jgi:hypothetical protein
MGVPQSIVDRKQSSPKKTSTSLSVKVTRITPIWPRKTYIQWLLRNPPADTGYSINIYRAEGANGPWELLTTTPLVDVYNYVDNSLSAPHDRTHPALFSMRRISYYRVSVTGPGGEVASSEVPPIPPLDRRREGIWRKLIRDAHLALKKGVGTEVAVLKRRTWGEPCTECQTSMGQTSRSHCGTCYGTGFVGGFWAPFYTWASRGAAPVDVQTTQEGKTETHQVNSILGYIPFVEVDDVLCFLRDNKRYKVDRVSTTEIHTRPVHQELILSELSRSSVEYKVAVDPWRDPEWF